MMLCSSVVTMQPVSLAAARRASPSRGFIVWKSSTRAETPSPESSSAAASARWTIRPVAAMVTSLPSRSMAALPELELVAVYRVRDRLNGHAAEAQVGRAVVLDEASTAWRISLPSQGLTTVMPGMALMSAMSSRHWWVAPSSPTERPPWEPTHLTFRCG